MSDIEPGTHERTRGSLLEGPRRLSSSLIWTAQASYYDRSGIDAWSSGEVPHLLTTGPLITRSYVRLIEGFLDDLDAGRLGAFADDQPLYLVELGAGTGRLGFNMVRAIERSRARGRARYVLTDRVEANLDFYARHPSLAGYFENEMLDLAAFDPVVDTAIELRRSGRTIGPGGLSNPVVVVANYFFDVIPQDLYVLEGGELFEELVALYSDDPLVGAGHHDFFRHLFLATERVPVAPDRYGDGRDETLHRAGALFSEGRRFLFPASAIAALEHATGLGDGRALVLIGERPSRFPSLGGDGLDTMVGQDQLREDNDDEVALEAERPGQLLSMGIHGGSMSLPIDLEVLALSKPGSRLFRPPALPTGLEVACLVLGEALGGAASLGAAYEHTVGTNGPEDTYLVCKAALERGEAAGVSALLAVVRTGAYDPYLFQRIYPVLDAHVEECRTAVLEELERVAGHVEELDYPIDDKTDLAFGLALLFAKAGRYEPALRFFTRSLEHKGERAEALFNVALCELHLERPEQALVALERANAADPSYEPAVALRAQVLEEKARREPGEEVLEPGPATGARRHR